MKTSKKRPKMLGVTLAPELAEALKALSIKKDCPQTVIARMALRQYIAREEAAK